MKFRSQTSEIEPFASSVAPVGARCGRDALLVKAFNGSETRSMIENSVALRRAAEIYRAGARGGAQRARPWLPSFPPLAHVDGTLVAAESRAVSQSQVKGS